MQVIIEREFHGYPNGEDKAYVNFAPSEKPIDVPDAFGELIIKKGLARAAAAAPAPQAE